MRILRLIGAACALAFSGMAQAALTLPYSSVIVFGDSLVDAGNARIASLQRNLPDPANPLLGYDRGRFSNGPNFADYLSDGTASGAQTLASFAGGSNFAFGGTTAQDKAGDPLPSFADQLGLFAQSGQMIAADALVIVTFGGNDVRDTRFTPGKVDFRPSADALRSGLTALLAAGARNILVTGLPDIGSLPEARTLPAGSASRTELSDRSARLNLSFASVTARLDKASDANVDFFNLLAFQQRVVADPTSVGLPASLDTVRPCILTARCGTSLFFDPIHPTTIVHSAIADGIATQLAAVPEPRGWALMIGGVGLIGGALRRRRGMAGAAA